MQNVDTDFGVLVQWDRTFSVRVNINPDIGNEVCGMCGSCDGEPDNDWIIGPNTDQCTYRLSTSKIPGDTV